MWHLPGAAAPAYPSAAPERCGFDFWVSYLGRDRPHFISASAPVLDEFTKPSPHRAPPVARMVMLQTCNVFCGGVQRDRTYRVDSGSRIRIANTER